ncbi:MAG: aminoglycoside phosphotransferase family protein [Devosia sp.]
MSGSTEIAAQYREAIRKVRPDLGNVPMVLHTRGWDSNAVEARDTIFKFPKHAEAPARLRREAKCLGLIAPRVPLAVPRMKLHETPMLFSEHVMIPGAIIETAGYNALGEAQRQAMAEKLAGFYAALHAIPITEAIAAGAEPKPEWPDATVVLPLLRDHVPKAVHHYAEQVFAAYLELPNEEEIFGYFDGHGWNMAFDHERGVLNGVYDFADAAIGPLTREFTYSSLTSTDLTERLITAYERIAGKAVDRRAVAIRMSVQNFSELADLDGPNAEFIAAVVRWYDYAQSRPETSI